MQPDHTAQEIDEIMQQAWKAFHIYRHSSLRQRAQFMRCIAEEITNCGDALIDIAQQETNLPAARLITERARTIFQLNSYADFCESGHWLDVRIDTADNEVTPPRTDIRKTMTGLGPVAVFGAANFPFAYSTAGGDTACAFAAGCPVMVKAHPGHVHTSDMVAGAIKKAAVKCGMPAGIFALIYGASSAAGEVLVKHEYTKAVGFTGSFTGGKQLFDWGSQRKNPIPVFAEMSSVNPFFILPQKMRSDSEAVAKMLAASVTLNAGQFCTNPGIIIALENDALQYFIQQLSQEIKACVPERMLSEAICKNYDDNKASALSQPDVFPLTIAETAPGHREAVPTIAITTATNFIKNPVLQQEVFGPYSLIVRCASMEEMEAVASTMQGQLTASIMAKDEDLESNSILVNKMTAMCGRIIFNGVPTGVQVGLAMQHGGPFPATSDSRFTSVGGDGIKRFARPVAYQNCPQHLLPDELKDANPLNMWRMVNDKWQQ